MAPSLLNPKLDVQSLIENREEEEKVGPELSQSALCKTLRGPVAMLALQKSEIHRRPVIRWPDHLPICQPIEPDIRGTPVKSVTKDQISRAITHDDLIWIIEVRA